MPSRAPGCIVDGLSHAGSCLAGLQGPGGGGQGGLCGRSSVCPPPDPRAPRLLPAGLLRVLAANVSVPLSALSSQWFFLDHTCQ